MKTKYTSTEIMMIGTMIIPFIYLGLIWNQLPATISTHYKLNGTPDGWMLKETVALASGVFSIVIYLVLRFLPNIDPKGQLQSSNYERLRFVITVAFAAIVGWMWYMASHQNNNQKSVAIVLALVGLLLAGMGNYMTTVKPNWFIGIRTPWTLQSEVVWRKTHRMGGRLMVAGGLVSAVLALVVPMPYTIGVVVSVILTVSIVPIVYSYVYFRQEKAHQLN